MILQVVKCGIHGKLTEKNQKSWKMIKCYLKVLLRFGNCQSRVRYIRRPPMYQKFFESGFLAKNGFFREVKLDLGGDVFLGSIVDVFIFILFFCMGYAFSGLVWLVAWLGVAWLSNQLSKCVVRYECRHLVCKPLVLFFKIY